MKPKLRLSRKLPIAYEMVRLKTVKALGISFPLMHLGPSDGVIEQRPKKSPSRPGLLFALCKNKFLSIAAMHTQLPRMGWTGRAPAPNGSQSRRGLRSTRRHLHDPEDRCCSRQHHWH